MVFNSLQEVPEENYDLPYHLQNDNGEAVMIKIDVPVPLREEPRFPKEIWKTFLCKLYFFETINNLLNVPILFQRSYCLPQT